MRRNGGISTSGQKSDVTIVFGDPNLILNGIFSRFGDVLGPFWAFFHCACGETGVFLLPVKHLTSPSFSATPISYGKGYFRDLGTFRGRFVHFFHCACAETGAFLLLVKNLTSPSFSATPVSIEGDIFAIGGV